MNVDEIARHFHLIRSKDAGPFMLTIDLFFASEASRVAFERAGVFSPAVVSELYGVDADDVALFSMPQAHALKISFTSPGRRSSV